MCRNIEKCEKENCPLYKHESLICTDCGMIMLFGQIWKYKDAEKKQKLENNEDKHETLYH